MNLSAKVFTISGAVALSVGLIHSYYGENVMQSEDSDTILQNNVIEEASAPKVNTSNPFSIYI